MAKVKVRTINIKTLVRQAEGEELTKKPVAYTFGGRVEKPDSGPNSGIYEKP